MAALLCGANIVMVSAGGHMSLPGDVSSVGDGFWLALGTVFMLGAMCSPQIGMLVLIRLTHSQGLQRLYLAASVVMVLLFGLFVATADLTGSSTAGLALVFIPIWLALASFLPGLVLLGIHSWRRRPTSTGA